MLTAVGADLLPQLVLGQRAEEIGAEQELADHRRQGPVSVDQLAPVAAGQAQHEAEIVIGDQDVVWKADSAFGEYLRQIREAAGLTLREAAERFETSFTYLHRLETGKRTTPPTTKLIEKVARAYGRDLQEVIRAAGFVRNVSPDVNLEVDIRVLFDAVISQPGLRPIGLEHRDIGYYSPMQKQQVVDLLLKYEEHRQRGGRPVHEILEETKRRLEAQTLPVDLGDLFKDDEEDES